MANGLQQQALESVASEGGAAKPVAVSLEVQLGGESWFRTAAPAPGEAAPRLRVRKLPGAHGAIELTVRDSQVGCPTLSALWDPPKFAVHPCAMSQ